MLQILVLLLPLLVNPKRIMNLAKSEIFVNIDGVSQKIDIEQSIYPSTDSFSIDGQSYDMNCDQSIIFMNQNNKIDVYQSNYTLTPTKQADMAQFIVIHLTNYAVFLQTQTAQCDNNCLPRNLSEITTKNQTYSFVNNTVFGIAFRLGASSNFDYMSSQQQYNENGQYQIIVYKSDKQQPSLFIDCINEGNSNRNMPILWLSLFIIVTIIICFIGPILNKKCQQDQYESLDGQSTVFGDIVEWLFAPRVQSNRLLSLDAFRGLSLLLMIFVNLGGGSFYIFNHSPYDGLTIADLIFPAFLWIMGTTFGMTAKVNNRSTLALNGLRRGITLFLIGMVLVNNGYDLSNWRIPGVLQIIGINYMMLVAMVILDSLINKQQKQQLVTIPILIYVHLILAIYLIITYVPKLDGCPRGYTGPGGISDQGKYSECEGGSLQYLMNKMLGDNHQFQNPFPQKLYGTYRLDPEGFFQTLSSFYLAFLGYLEGRILKLYKNDPKIVIKHSLALVAFTGCIGGLIAYSIPIPINKQLWSISFVLLNGSISQSVFTLFYYLVDVKGWIDGPYKVGMNSIFIYVGHEIFTEYFPFGFKNNGSHMMMGISNLLGVYSWMAVAFILYKKKIFITV